MTTVGVDFFGDVDILCHCGEFVRPVALQEHQVSLSHVANMRILEGVMCECGVKYHPTLEPNHWFLEPKHRAYLEQIVTCVCGSHVKRKTFMRHLKTQTHEQRLKRRITCK